MTRKDFKMIAELLKAAKRDEKGANAPVGFTSYGSVPSVETVDHVIGLFTAGLKATNPAFNAEKFKAACQPEE